MGKQNYESRSRQKIAKQNKIFIKKSECIFLPSKSREIKLSILISESAMLYEVFRVVKLFREVKKVMKKQLSCWRKNGGFCLFLRQRL